MDDVRLAEPGLEYRDDIAAFRAEAMADAAHIPGGSGLESFEDPAAWIDHCRALTDPATLPPGYVAAEEWMLLRGAQNRILGLVNIRLSIDDDYLREYGGHIGYGVRPSERRKGYASQMLALALERCRELGIDKALVTCDKDNVASAKTILKNGGLLGDEYAEDNGNIIQRYWITLKEGMR